MKKRVMYTVLLCAALLLSVGVAPIPANTAAPLDEPYASGDPIDVTFEALGYGQGPLDFVSAIAPLYGSGTTAINRDLIPGEALVPASVYTLTVATNGTGSGTVDPAVGTHTYISGTTVILTAIVNTGSMFTGWSGDATGMTNPVIFTMDGDKIITATFDLPYVFLQSWGNEIGTFHEPSGIAIGGEHIYVCDAGSNRIQVFDLYGTPLVAFGEKGDGDGQFDHPWDIAVDGSGNVYVADSGNDRIQKFTSDGTFLTQWGSEGSGDGQFNEPHGIAVDGSGNVYVADAYNDRIQKFTSDGTFLTKWGQFGLPYGITVDGSGNVYVVDGGNDRIQKFTSDGTFLTQWETLLYPTDIAVDGSGNVYVEVVHGCSILGVWYGGIEKYTSDGTFLTKWGGAKDTVDLGVLPRPGGIAVGGSGNVYAADSYNNRIEKFTPDGEFLTLLGSGGQFNEPLGIAIDRSGNVYVVDGGNDRIQKFTSDGTFLTKWGGFGRGEGQFWEPTGITVDGSGNVYVADTRNDRIQKFTSDGAFLTKWESEGSGDGHLNHPDGVAVDESGNVYVADTWNDRIQKFTSDGTFLTKWGSGGSGDGRFHSPDGVAVDESGNVYVADTWNDRIQKFTSDGAFLTKWGSEGSGDGQFDHPEGIAADGSGNVYVADTRNDRIQKFTSDGAFLTKWGSEGCGDGQFKSPRGIAVDWEGNLYVVDGGNDRIQKFAPDYPSPDPVHGLALNGSFEETPNLVRWTYGGELPVGLVDDAIHGIYSVRLGEPVPQEPQPQAKAWLYQTMYIRPEWERPVLAFRYRMFVNDIIHYSDFHVWLTRSNGALLAEIKRDGFRSCHDPPLAPPPGYDLGWRSASYDLSGFKGQTVRVVFENRNLHSGYSWGIWTYVDDVRVVDAGPLPGPYRTYFPLVMSSGSPCDLVVYGLGIESVVRTGRP